MFDLIGRCEICYSDIKDEESRKFCNNCGNDYHERCIAQIIDHENKCPHCKGQFVEKPNGEKMQIYDEEDYSYQSRPSDQTSISSYQPKWQQMFIFFELVFVALIFAYGVNIGTYQGILLFIIASSISILISKFVAARFQT